MRPHFHFYLFSILCRQLDCQTIWKLPKNWLNKPHDCQVNKSASEQIQTYTIHGGEGVTTEVSKKLAEKYRKNVYLFNFFTFLLLSIQKLCFLKETLNILKYTQIQDLSKSYHIIIINYLTRLRISSFARGWDHYKMLQFVADAYNNTSQISVDLAMFVCTNAWFSETTRARATKFADNMSN